MGTVDTGNGGHERHIKHKGPRLYHKKSRTGCARCRARRVKCDEAHPTCGKCARHDVACVYEGTSAPSPREREASINALPSQVPAFHEALVSTNLLQFGDKEQPESRERRLLELRLLHNYVYNTSHTFPATNQPSVLNAWSVELPKLALVNEGLLYQVLSISALHLRKTETDTPELLAAHRNYLGLCLRKHRGAVAHLSTASADAVCFTSILILFDALASLQERSLESYTPPMQWLQMARGAWSVFNFAWKGIENDASAKVMAVVKAEPRFDGTNNVFTEENRAAFRYLLDQDVPIGSVTPWDTDILEAYERSLSYIGSIQRAIDVGEHRMSTCRRLMAFPLLVPARFVQLIEAQDSRALVILAHYFIIAAHFDDIWWLGGTARREVHGIQSALPKEWQQLLPLPESV